MLGAREAVDDDAANVAGGPDGRDRRARSPCNFAVPARAGVQYFNERVKVTLFVSSCYRLTGIKLCTDDILIRIRARHEAHVVSAEENVKDVVQIAAGTCGGRPTDLASLASRASAEWSDQKEEEEEGGGGEEEARRGRAHHSGEWRAKLRVGPLGPRT